MSNNGFITTEAGSQSFLQCTILSRRITIKERLHYINDNKTKTSVARHNQSHPYTLPTFNQWCHQSFMAFLAR